MQFSHHHNFEKKKKNDWKLIIKFGGFFLRLRQAKDCGKISNFLGGVKMIENTLKSINSRIEETLYKSIFTCKSGRIKTSQDS